MLIVMVAEKPSLALSISKILSNNHYDTRKGFNGACSVHEWNGKFQNFSNCKFKMTSVCGHVMSLDFTSKYNNWDKTDPASKFYSKMCSYLSLRSLIFNHNLFYLFI